MNPLIRRYYGFKTKNRGRLGIFPKSFVHVKESEIDQSGIYPSASPKEPPIAAEITSTVREWLVLFKRLFVKQGDYFSLIKLYMNVSIVTKLWGPHFNENNVRNFHEFEKHDYSPREDNSFLE